MSFFHPALIDELLNRIKNDTTNILLCSVAPTEYSSAVGNQLASGVPIIDGPEDGDVFVAPGRRVVVIANLLVGTADGNATHWALVNTDGLELFATGELTGAPFAVVTSANYSLDTFNVTIAL